MIGGRFPGTCGYLQERWFGQVYAMADEGEESYNKQEGNRGECPVKTPEQQEGGASRFPTVRTSCA